MTFFQFAAPQPGQKYDYPTLGFFAADGAILDGTASNPAITTAPDAHWTAVASGPESGITRYRQPQTPPDDQSSWDGSLLVYDATTRAFVRKLPSDAIASTTGLGQALNAAYVAQLGKSNGTDDTSWLNAALSAGAGKVLRGTGGQTYLITAPLIVASGTTVDMTGCTVQLKSGSNCDMIQAASNSGARTVMDAAITSGQTTLTSATAAFAAGDVGATVWVYGAGGETGILKTTISSVTNATTAVLAASASTTVTAAPASVGARTTGITLRGGKWDRLDNTGYSFRFRRADKVTVTDMELDSATVVGALKYAINFGDCTNLTVERIKFNYYSDGVHLNGPIVGGTINNLRGYTRDDMVSLTPNDWSPYNDVYGDIVGVTVNDIQLDQGDNCAVKVLGGSPSTKARSIRVSNIGGTTTKAAQSFGGLVCLGDDTGNANTIGGFLDDITVTGVSGQVPNGSYLVQINGSNAGVITVDGVGFDNPNNTTAPIGIGASNTGTIQNIIIRNIRANRLQSNIINASGTCAVKRLSIDGVSVQQWLNTTSSSSLIQLGPGTGGITSVDVSNVRVYSSTGGALVTAASALASLSLDRVEMANSANNAYFVVASAVVTDCVVSRATGPAFTGGYIAQASGSGGFTRLSINDAHLNAGAGPVQASASTNVLGTLIIANSSLMGTSWGLGDFAVTAKIYCNNVVATPTANIANLRATANVTLSVMNSDFNSKTLQGTAGYLATSRTDGLRVDVDVLNNKATGDIAYNTNAAHACGVGPVSYTGTAWQHLATGATY